MAGQSALPFDQSIRIGMLGLDAEYAARVPMFLPDPRLFRTADAVSVSAGAIRRNLLDAFVFLSAIPLAALSSALYAHTDWMPIVLPRAGRKPPGSAANA